MHCRNTNHIGLEHSFNHTLCLFSYLAANESEFSHI